MRDEHSLERWNSYSEAHDAVLNVLRELLSGFQARLKGGFNYRFVSQAQAAPFERAHYHWVKSGGIGAPPAFDVSHFRAAVYNQAAAARQLEAFVHAQCVIACELCQAGIRGFEAEEVAVPYSMLRSLVERTAHVAWLADALKPLAKATLASDGSSTPLIESANTISKALYGTKMDWNKLRDVNLRSASKDEIAYIRTELTMDVSARNVLSSIDKLNKQAPGIRIAYEILCEFLHPNVGDLYSATRKAHDFKDAYGTRHLVREISLGPKDISGAPDLSRILVKTLEICCDALRVYPLALTDLFVTCDAADKLAKKFAHRVRKYNRGCFKKNDLCPCLSGLRIRDCR
ncbi:hypothetical protein [Prosthecomicrobium sp. N25]|uniref:hypothetical protein n=1 Tax=Prosthecomicrobium sp. N25 TaxID=3129254 RepID=UPI0030788C13